MAWSGKSWGVNRYNLNSTSASWGTSSGGSSTPGTALVYPKERFIRGWMASTPYEHKRTGSLWSYMIDAIEEQDYDLGGPGK